MSDNQIHTFLFTDIEGSTRLWESESERMQPALARHDDLLREVFTRFEGHVFKTVGDAFCVIFADPNQATLAAIEAQRQLQAEPWSKYGLEPGLCVRMALHSGTAQHRDGDYFGPALNRVARLLSAAHGGQILLSRTTQALVCGSLPPGVETGDLGERRLKDLLQPEHLYQLIASGLPSTFPPPRTMDARTDNLPSPLTELIDRQAERSAILDLLRDESTRLVTLTGTGGVGKTRLALESATTLAREFEHGVALVDLAPIADPNLLEQTIASVLGIRERGGIDLVQRLQEHLRNQRLLLWLDSCERVIGAAARVVALIEACPRLKILATSRASLRVRGEHLVLVSPLPIPGAAENVRIEDLLACPAAELFIRRAQAVLPSFCVTAKNSAAIAEICRQLNGLPLALELAAAQVSVLSVAAIATRLGHRLRLLTRGAADLPERQRTMQGVIAWSYDLLDVASQRLLRRLAVFEGGFTFDDAQGLIAQIAPDDDILKPMSTLVDHNLLQRSVTDQDEVRWQMLETIREFSAEQLAISGEGAEFRRAHASYFVTSFQEAETELRGSGQKVWLPRIEMEQDNLRTALRWAIDKSQVESGLQLAVAIWRFWYLRGSPNEGRDWLSQLLDGAQRQGVDRTMPHLCARATNALGALTRELGEWDRAGELFLSAWGLYRESGDEVGAAQALLNRGTVASDLGRYKEAETLYRDCREVWRQRGDSWNLALLSTNLGHAAAKQGRFAEANAALVEALDMWRALHDQWGEAIAEDVLGEVARQQGEFAESLELHRRALKKRLDLDNSALLVYSFHNLGLLAAAQNDMLRATRLLAAADSVRASIQIRLPIRDAEAIENTCRTARQALGDAAFELAWDEGRLMSRQEMAAAALEEGFRGLGV